MRSLKPLFFLFTTLVFCKVLSQQPGYEEVLQKELISNAIENTASAMEAPYVIMVSIDGFRHDYAEKHGAKNLLDMVKNGSSAVRMIPSFPSKTFPNHYSLVTGMYPQNHGIVANSFYDPELKKAYRVSNRDVVEDGSWYGGIPLWNLAQLQGMVSASYFWVGSEANVNGLHPKYYYKYDKQTPYEYRVKRVLEWLQLPPEQRPHMITLYFSLVDTIGHKYGPDAKETKEAVQYVDEQIGALRSGISELGLPINLIVTADHGMAEVYKLINIRDYVEVERERFFAGPVAMIYTKNEAETNDLYTTLSQQKMFRTYKRDQVPNYLNFSNNGRIGDLVLIADSPHLIINSKSDKKELDRIEGTHGYDPFDHQDMGAIFYVEGPTIKKGHTIAPFENIHVYPLVAKLLGLDMLMPVDGKAKVLETILEQ